MCHIAQSFSKRSTPTFFSLCMLTSVCLSSVNWLVVPWVVYHSTYNPCFLFRRTTRYDHTMWFEPPQTIRHLPWSPPPQFQNQPEASSSPRSARRSPLHWTCFRSRGRGLGSPKRRQSPGEQNFGYHVLALVDKMLSSGYRTFLEALKSALRWCLLVETVRTRLC